MDSSTNFQAPSHAAYFLWSCDKVYHKQEVCFLFVFPRLDCQLTIQFQSIGLKLTMYSYKWSWLTVVELSIHVCLCTLAQVRAMIALAIASKQLNQFMPVWHLRICCLASCHKFDKTQQSTSQLISLNNYIIAQCHFILLLQYTLYHIQKNSSFWTTANKVSHSDS